HARALRAERAGSAYPPENAVGSTSKPFTRAASSSAPQVPLAGSNERRGRTPVAAAPSRVKRTEPLTSHASFAIGAVSVLLLRTTWRERVHSPKRPTGPA